MAQEASDEVLVRAERYLALRDSNHVVQSFYSNLKTQQYIVTRSYRMAQYDSYMYCMHYY
jgi:hypothetical protein